MATPGRVYNSSLPESIEVDELFSNDARIIGDQLAKRAAKEKLFTRIGNRCIVSVKPSRGLAIFSDSYSKDYALKARELNEQPLPPHVFTISTSAYFHALRAQIDQSIVLLGDSNSGKSSVYRVLVRNLCDLSKTSKKKSRVQSNILKVDSVFSAFGNATTSFNQDASCFAQYTEIQFDQTGKMVGAKFIEYLLEKSRASKATDGGKSFHVFYYLLEGATHEERMKLHLSDPAHFSYLNGSHMVGFAQGKGSAPLDLLRENLKSLGIGRRHQEQLWTLLSAILHLGNIQFNEAQSDRYACSIKNFPQLQMVADMLGITATALQTVLTTRTRMVGKDNLSSLLDSAQAAEQRDYFARSLYSVCFGWIVEQINLKLCAADGQWANFVSILDIPGFAGTEMNDNGFYRLMVNYTNERIYAHTMHDLFIIPKEAFLSQEIEFNCDYESNKSVIKVLAGLRYGIIPMVDSFTIKKTSPVEITSKIYENHLESGVLVSSSSKTLSRSFGVSHFAGIVHYDSRDFVHTDSDVLQSDFVTLIRGDPENSGTSNIFLRNIFSDRLIATKKAADSVTVISAHSKARFPSMRRKSSPNDVEQDQLDATATVGHIFESELNTLLDTLCTAQPWFIYNFKPSESSSGKIDPYKLEQQVKSYNLVSLIGNPAVTYTSTYSFAEFASRYETVLSFNNRDPKTACSAIARSRNWKETDCKVGITNLFLGETLWRDLELQLIGKEESAKESADQLNNSADNFQNTSKGIYVDAFGAEGSEYSGDTESHYESEFDFAFNQNAFGDVEMGEMKKLIREREEVKESHRPPVGPPPPKPLTNVRRNWLCFTWTSTFCFIPICLSGCGGMKQKERQLAWREKFALCIIIFFMNAFVLFVIIGTGYIICPKDPRSPAQSPGEISGFFESNNRASVYMYGHYYRIPDVISKHVKTYMDQQSSTPEYFEASVNGQDVTWMFRRQDYPSLRLTRNSGPICRLKVPSSFQVAAEEQPNNTKWYPHKPESIIAVEKYRKGSIVVERNFLQKIKSESSADRRFLIVYDKVYDLSPFYDTARNPTQGARFFLGDWFTEAANALTQGLTVRDASAEFADLARQNKQIHDDIMQCLNNIFLMGGLDHRNDIECIIANYILLGASVLLVAVIGFKFIAALQFPGQKAPEDHDRFVLCQVPCYTEGETSLRRTIDSLTNLRYDDKHKLLFIICDGMIIGSGNDRPTPRIVLDILGVDPNADPETVVYQSLGDGNRQLNSAKVYSGLYELNGHVVPYIVVVKVGKSSERTKPGNRGKRDSQLILMRFLMRVHFNQAMSPLELEIHHHMKNIIGVDPSFYEFVFMVDADTQVEQDSLNHLVSHMTRDSKIAGTCGETSIANDRKSFTSMIQVYEYFISHHMAKAFESLFGSVTCLPGCFCMYRVRTSYKNTPVLIAPGLVADYSENAVDTLHLKNLLHLGEDRYLTTLTMKHFPSMKTTFCSDAKCQTYAPDQWSVLLSQRRRWINSTVHNLFELLRLGELCGFCCFSMRFVVFIDLMATFIQPSALLYVAYLVVLASLGNLDSIPIISLILIGAVYGFQYIIAIPLFGFYIPIYSFWHFDDFSWGNTRLVVESDKNEKIQKEPEYFDPASVPLLKWSDYAASRTGSSDSDTKSKFSGVDYAVSHLPSEYTSSIAGDSVLSKSFGLENARFPSDEELLNEIRHILSTTDLMKVTKKSVRDQLSRLFRVDVSPKRDYIHHCIDNILKGEL